MRWGSHSFGAGGTGKNCIETNGKIAHEPQVTLAIIISYPTSVSGIIVLLKINQEILLNRADFAWQKQPEDNLMCLFLGHGIMAHISWPVSNSNPRIALYNDPVFHNSMAQPLQPSSNSTVTLGLCISIVFLKMVSDLANLSAVNSLPHTCYIHTDCILK